MKEMLKEVVTTYFRILKQSTDAAAAASSGEADVRGKWRSLLPSALAGLCEFAHLINVDTVEDLLLELKLLLNAAIMQGDGQSLDDEKPMEPGGAPGGAFAGAEAGSGRVDWLPLDAALNCVRTAMRTLGGKSVGAGNVRGQFARELIAVDESSFTASLFALLPRLAQGRGNSALAPVATECVELVLLKRKE